jgi:hypothetical protein
MIFNKGVVVLGGRLQEVEVEMDLVKAQLLQMLIK